MLKCFLVKPFVLLYYFQFKEEEMSRPCYVHKKDEKYKFAMHMLEGNFKVNLKEVRWEVWTGFSWLMTVMSGGFL
jgi:hypothetical protein